MAQALGTFSYDQTGGGCRLMSIELSTWNYEITGLASLGLDQDVLVHITDRTPDKVLVPSCSG